MIVKTVSCLVVCAVFLTMRLSIDTVLQAKDGLTFSIMSDASW